MVPPIVVQHDGLGSPASTMTHYIHFWGGVIKGKEEGGINEEIPPICFSLVADVLPCGVLLNAPAPFQAQMSAFFPCLTPVISLKSSRPKAAHYIEAL